MRNRIMAAALLVLLAPILSGLGAALGAGQTVVDRVVVRIENDILTLSEMRELAAYQQFAGSPAASAERLLNQLIEQWIIEQEAETSRFPAPPEGDVARELEDRKKQFASPEAYATRLRELGLTEAALERHVARQLYLVRYLEYKFRPAAQVTSADIERYYRETLLPELAGRGQPAPALETVSEHVRELLVQQQIDRLAEKWLGQTRANLRIEIVYRPGEMK